MSGDSAKPTATSPFANLHQFKAKDPAQQQAQASVVGEVSKELDQVADQNGFHSREPAKPAKAATPKRRRFGAADAGPKVQLNIKLPPELKDRYYRMAEERGHTDLYRLLEEALDAIEAKSEQGSE